jgi:hypothetical protein
MKNFIRYYAMYPVMVLLIVSSGIILNEGGDINTTLVIYGMMAIPLLFLAVATEETMRAVDEYSLWFKGTFPDGDQ